jgi:thiamine-phosphate pyrophosphorylase
MKSFDSAIALGIDHDTDLKKAMLLCAITDRAWVGRQTLLEQIEDSLKGGVTCLQLREKGLPFDDFLAEAVEVKKVCAKYNVPFIVNDNVEVAVKCEADGVHIGQGDMDAAKARKLIGNKILGVSAQTAEQAVQAEKVGADYIGVGAVFPTPTKLDADSVNRETLMQITNSVKIPVVAIGGINKHNMLELKGTGINGVALVSAIYSAENITLECAELKALAKDVVR